MKTLAQIQKELKAPKSQRNTFGNYNYRNCEDILEALKPLLGDDDKFFITDDVVLIGDRYYVKATATFNEHSAVAFAREELTKKGMDSAQITGATSSYARKYALDALFAIDDTKDADSQEPEKPKPVAAAKKADAKKEASAQEKMQTFFDCLGRAKTKELYEAVKPKKDTWVLWVKDNVSEEKSNELNDKFLELAKQFS